MRQVSASQATWPLRAAAAVIALIALAAFEIRSFDTHMWTDEIFTVTLVQASSLLKLWAGIVSGIDGNPPLYLTLSWMLAHVTPSSPSVVVILRTASLMMTIAATLMLYRFSLRSASRLAAWTGSFLFVALNTNLTVLATELRTYALYYFLAVLAVLLQQRLSERGRTIDAVLLVLGYAALALSHNFGIVYVGCIALSGIFSQWGQGWRQLRLAILAPIPAVVLVACWIPFFIQQSAVGKPYLWITSPDLGQLLLIVWSTPLAMCLAVVELFCIAGVAIEAFCRQGPGVWRTILTDPRWQFARYVVAVAVSISAVTLAAWTASVLLFPIFVPRYFVPQVMVSFALHVAFCELIIRAARARSTLKIASGTRWAAVVLPVLFSIILLQRPSHGQDRCTDAQNAFFETGFVSGHIPVIADSPHVFIPRSYYAGNSAAYRFPLDWDVVMKYPLRDPGNATDFHILERLKAWLPMPSVVSTEDIVRDYPEFLVIESDRAWFDNLRQTRDVSAEKLAEVNTPRGGTCTLWKVASVKLRP
jgi:hypothetical protein